jgi:TIR domain/Pentapeptide repeats (8 copies)
LLRAHLDGADLNEANFSSAALGGTVLSGVDLSVAIGLDTVHHHGPSSIGIDTLYISKGSIPEIFLRGAGVPDSLITYAASLTKQAILFYSCFISYSSKDESFAKSLYFDLQNNGVRCWFAPEDLKIGDKTRVQIDESIRVYDKLLLILSKQSITSDWVEKEVETAMELERQQKRTVLFPIRLDDEVMKIQSGWAADIRRSRNIGDFRRWKIPDVYQEVFNRLLRDLKAET